MFSSKTDEWETPQALFDELNREFGFTLDVCALPENAKCDLFFTPKTDGLSQSWKGHMCWMNPPYGREIGKWVKKHMKNHNEAQRWFACFRLGQIQDGFMTTYTARPK
jgi:phage N-6-adenine-methyltransferase